jgi:hypothetical protein
MEMQYVISPLRFPDAISGARPVQGVRLCSNIYNVQTFENLAQAYQGVGKWRYSGWQGTTRNCRSDKVSDGDSDNRF